MFQLTKKISYVIILNLSQLQYQVVGLLNAKGWDLKIGDTTEDGPKDAKDFAALEKAAGLPIRDILKFKTFDVVADDVVVDDEERTTEQRMDDDVERAAIRAALTNTFPTLGETPLTSMIAWTRPKFRNKPAEDSPKHWRNIIELV